MRDFVHGVSLPLKAKLLRRRKSFCMFRPVNQTYEQDRCTVGRVLHQTFDTFAPFALHSVVRSECQDKSMNIERDNNSRQILSMMIVADKYYFIFTFQPKLSRQWVEDTSKKVKTKETQDYKWADFIDGGILQLEDSEGYAIGVIIVLHMNHISII